MATGQNLNILAERVKNRGNYELREYILLTAPVPGVRTHQTPGGRACWATGGNKKRLADAGYIIHPRI
jgi:hypothetical protein